MTETSTPIGRKRRRAPLRAGLAAVLISITGFACAGPEADKDAGAQSTQGLMVMRPRATETIAARVPAAVYFDIHNQGAAGDRLLAVRGDVAEAIELHESVRDADGVTQMRPLAAGRAAPAGETVSFEPGGAHVMLIGLSAPLKEGDEFPLTLVFESAGEVEIVVKVVSRTDMDGGSSAHERH